MRFNRWFFLAALAILTPLPAHARTRDDVMSGAFRCAAIGDSRQWLDCYYGAAQPARAQLGLPPAPAVQIGLAALPPAGGEVRDGQIRDQVMSGAFGCNNIADERQWLDCYYAAAQPIRSQLGLPPAPQARAPISPGAGFAMSLPAPALNPRADGPEKPIASLPARPANNADNIASSMVSYVFDHDGVFTVTLANGQVWHQHPTDDNHAFWDKPAASYSVNISRGWLGSYSLKIQGTDVKYEIDRLK